MVALNVPVDAIDPERALREWVKRYTYHLDLLPPLMEVLIWMTIPSIRASATDQVKITGGGFVDNVKVVDPTAGPAADATYLWDMVVDYVHAVGEWITPARPAPALSQKPDADPLLARGHALETAGWLIDHAALIAGVRELDEFEEVMFEEIRRLRARYGVFSTARRPKERCSLCGELAVTLVWVDGKNGSPKPVRASRCGNCGDVRTDLPEVVVEARVRSRTLSEACAASMHELCESVHCDCECHESPG